MLVGLVSKGLAALPRRASSEISDITDQSYGNRETRNIAPRRLSRHSSKDLCSNQKDLEDSDGDDPEDVDSAFLGCQLDDEEYEGRRESRAMHGNIGVGCDSLSGARFVSSDISTKEDGKASNGIKTDTESDDGSWTMESVMKWVDGLQPTDAASSVTFPKTTSLSTVSTSFSNLAMNDNCVKGHRRDEVRMAGEAIENEDGGRGGWLPFPDDKEDGVGSSDERRRGRSFQDKGGTYLVSTDDQGSERTIPFEPW